MADVVLIEGSLTPAMGYLRRGEQAEVPLTDLVNELTRKGYIIIRGAADGSAPPLQLPDQTLPTVPQTPDQTLPTVPDPGNQDLVEATPVPQEPDQSIPEVPNPDVDNSLVDITDPGTDAPVTRTATTKSTAKK